MFRNTFNTLFLLLYFGVVWPGMAQEITIAVSANAQFAVEEIITAYSEISDTKIRRVIGSSGKLSTQIRNGAPFHIFLSADTFYPEELHNAGYTAERPQIYAYGKLVWWSTVFDNLDDLQAKLTGNDVQKIAIANPRLAPYGKQASRLIEKTLPEITGKLVYGRSVAQVNQYILAGAVDIGLTAQSVLFSKNGQSKGSWQAADSSIYEAIAQSAVMTKSAESALQPAVRAFYEFLFSPRAAAIFRKYGYQIP